MATAPIVVIEGAPRHSPFAGYLPEILLIEGYMCFEMLDLREEALTDEHLDGAAVAIVEDVELSEREMGMLEDFARSGGALVAMRPQWRRRELFGLDPVEGTYSRAADVYLRADFSVPWLANLPAPAFQFHGEADMQAPVDGAAVAHVGGRPDSPSIYPGVWVRQVGEGWAVAFTFDLAASVALTHQGVPRERAHDGNPDRDRDGMLKPNDFFIGYLDPNLRRLPQADLQQELLVRVLRHVSPIDLPRVWYFPSPTRAAAVIRGDSDGQSRGHYDNALAIAEEYGHSYTIQVMEQHLPQFTREEAAELRERGHDIGIHPIYPLMPTVQEATEILEHLVSRFEERYGLTPTSYVAHSCLFPGWAEFPRELARHGCRLSFDFAAGRYLREGYVGGTGLPARFMARDGALIDCFQQTTIQSDDGYLGPKIVMEVMEPEETEELTREVIRDCTRFNTLYHPCCHPTNIDRHERAEGFFRCILEELNELELPSFGGHQWMQFNLRRRGLTLAPREHGGELQVTVDGCAELDEFVVLLPQVADVRCSGEHVETAVVEARGEEWMAVPLSPDGAPRLELTAGP
ncbi:MAG: hypothetical protein U9R79_00620 [Armatimonadota bacterium]|nr:hypothetical protein [Armatimonadota bacterium]